MKKIAGFVLLAGILLTGCGSDNDWVANVQAPAQYIGEQELPITIEIKEQGQPVTGLQVKAQFEMKKMDHGKVEAMFTDGGNGTYTGKVKLPMGGEWLVNVNMSNGKRTEEQTLQFKTERVEAK
ncbi:FixH family protein [Effusibacillus lacus]|uniref:YtkA-like domain-containing protein n=1 Tax=Effusibacillus lacus TaxID=1348429 RepID=A0A292YSD5_9BACL|nr:FixH family protein [Effusibacillus lacus]TCS76089.1 YtkA-like protein [Effusibacillus lacus]GAX91395.1 hypothetical protein EFBL_3064 [Effusibacillus lacus]